MLLDCKVTRLYNCRPLDVARRADCRAFLASDTVQAYLDEKWYHHFDYEQRLMRIPVPFWVGENFDSLLYIVCVQFDGLFRFVWHH